MECVSNAVRVSIPSYFSSLPVPSSISGFASLSAGDWVSLIVACGSLGFVVYSTTKVALDQKPALLKFLHEKGLISTPPDVMAPCGRCNASVRKDCDKVVDKFDIEDLGDKVAFCRCWKSKKFPYCDGSHNQHNKDTGDNVGPLLVEKTK